MVDRSDAFLAPRLPVDATAQSLAVGAAAISAAGEVGGLVIRSARRRLRTMRFADWCREVSETRQIPQDDNEPPLPHTVPATPIRQDRFESPFNVEEIPAPNSVPRCKLSDKMTPNVFGAPLDIVSQGDPDPTIDELTNGQAANLISSTRFGYGTSL